MPTREADLVIGGVLIPGATAPKLVTRAMVAPMKKGAVIVDVAIDQGGCVETARPTSHSNPSYVVDGVVHYCVTNMPGAVPHTSTLALTNSTFPYVLRHRQPGRARGPAAGRRFCRGSEYMAGHAHLSRRGREPAPALDGGRKRAGLSLRAGAARAIAGCGAGLSREKFCLTYHSIRYISNSHVKTRQLGKRSTAGDAHH